MFWELVGIKSHEPVIKRILRAAWNQIRIRRRPKTYPLNLGLLVSDGEVTRTPITMSDARRTEHIAILGKTGSGKSSLLRSLCAQDIANDRGFVYFDLHGDATPFILRRVAEEEQRRGCDLSDKLIVIDPADREWSVGVNVLGETKQDDSRFVRSAEFAGLLRHRWNLESLGARTEELLRNSLYVLGDNKLTLLELAPLLVNPTFRSLCVSRVTNQEIKEYFETRYDALSVGMQAVMREPILTKTSTFTADPRFRHIVGQQQSTFSISEAMQNGYWVVLNLHKGQLGEEATTLGSLFLSMIKYALFSRQSHALFTLSWKILTTLFLEHSIRHKKGGSVR